MSPKSPKITIRKRCSVLASLAVRAVAGRTGTSPDAAGDVVLPARRGVSAASSASFRNDPVAFLEADAQLHCLCSRAHNGCNGQIPSNCHTAICSRIRIPFARTGSGKLHMHTKQFMAAVACGLTFTSVTLFSQQVSPVGPPVPIQNLAPSIEGLPEPFDLNTSSAIPGGVIIGQTYEGIDFLHSDCSCLPPDTNAAVGNNFVVETVNFHIRIFR
jgi:hypothetical protein